PSVPSGLPIPLTEKKLISDLTVDGKLNGKPVLDTFHYDKTNGWLFLWVAQTEDNAHGPSPLGDCKCKPGDEACKDDPSYCPSKTTGEPYYVCPAKGCPTYRIELNDPDYKPGEEDCGDPYTEGYEWPGPPANENELVIKGTTTPVARNP